jgi:hypothetical protein
MGRAKEIKVKVIPSKIANEFIKKYHYSGKVVNNSNLHFGCFLDGKLHGVLQYGASMDKKASSKYVVNTGWNEFLELNRMAFDDYLPKNSESRCIAISIKLIKKNAPHIKWVVSFSDGTQSGDGTIYRAVGFYLTNIKKNSSIFKNDKGQVACSMTFSKSHYALKNNGSAGAYKLLESKGYKKAQGFQLRYIYLIDKSCKLNVPIIPYSKIDEIGAGMYRGKKISIKERNASIV